MLIKIAPDLTLSELDEVVAIARRRKVDGMIVGNTTVLRPDWLKDQETAKEAGGLSGRPLFRLATRMLAETYVRAEGAFPLIGTGGIDSGETALAKIRAGACLVQVYSSLVFRGLAMVGEIKQAPRRRTAPRRPCRPRRIGRRRRRGDDRGGVAGVGCYALARCAICCAPQPDAGSTP